MKLYRGLLFFLFSTLSFLAYSQATPLKFERDFLNLGNIVDYTFQKFKFNVKNVSKEKVEITLKNKTFQINPIITKANLAPGESTEIIMEFYPDNVGVFKESIYITDNKNNEYELKAMGYITALSDEYLNSNKDKRLRGDKDVVFIVVDANTMDAMPNTTLSILGLDNSQKYERYTNDLGVLSGRFPDGKYRIEGYYQGKKKTIVGTEVDVAKNLVMILMDDDKAEEVPKSVEKIQEKEIEEVKVPDSVKEIELVPDEKYQSASPALNITLMLDISNSMNLDNRIDQIKKSLRHFITNFKDDDKLSIITFNDSVYVNYRMSKVTEKQKIIYFIDNIETSGSTQGLSSIISVLNIIENTRESGRQNLLIMSTDGELAANNYQDKLILGKIDEFRKKGGIFSVLSFSKRQHTLQQLKRMSVIGGGIVIDMNGDKLPEDVILKNLQYILDK